MGRNRCHTFLVDESGGKPDSSYMASLIEQLLSDKQFPDDTELILVLDNCS